MVLCSYVTLLGVHGVVEKCSEVHGVWHTKYQIPRCSELTDCLSTIALAERELMPVTQMVFKSVTHYTTCLPQVFVQIYM